MFKRDHHVRIASVLQSLDADCLRERKCYFGGGTSIVLMKGEYRESFDIDFLCSDLSGYREIRHLFKEKNGIDAISRGLLKAVGGVRADQYGIRTMLDVGGAHIKFEIVFEGRISFDTPGSEDQICGVTILTRLDLLASKLLANSDRWNDRSTYSRDIIDIAMLSSGRELFQRALKKATAAYGVSVQRDLTKAVDYLQKNPKRLDECMGALNMHDTPKAVLWERIRKLAMAR